MTTAAPYRIEITDEQKEFYKENGFLIVRNILNAEQIEMYKKRAREIVLGDYPPDMSKRIVKDVRIAKGKVQVEDPEWGMWKLMNPDKWDPTFRAYPETPELLDCVEQLIGADLIAFLLMVIYKPPGIDAVHNYHQDGLYFNFAPHDLVVGTWLALDRADGENGGLRLIPGSHKLGYLSHKMPKGEDVNRGVFGVEGYDDHPTEVVPVLEPGDCAFFHARTLHKTGGNPTDRHRRIITVHFANASCKPTGAITPEFDMRLVRGQRHEGGI